jgi:16S rRNA (adenine1518-N6/adenine1519-N6)-dimethyltransferase
MQLMIKPKKSLGQNFLIDNNIIDKIIKLSEIKNNNIVEIGPGTGNLTEKILDQNPKNLILIEKDHNLIDYLKIKFKNLNNIKIFNEDILKFNLEKEIKINSIIIGNLPYNISSQILAKLIKFNKWPPRYKKLILMFQKEVAEKIIAKHKSSSFGRIAILTRARLKLTNSFDISKNSFYPVPKVKSTILAFKPIVNRDFTVQDVSNLEKITHIFFSKKRKMINKAFNILFKKPKLVAKKIDIDLSLRPNQISEKQYYKITECFEKKF